MFKPLVILLLACELADVSVIFSSANFSKMKAASFCVVFQFDFLVIASSNFCNIARLERENQPAWFLKLGFLRGSRFKIFEPGTKFLYISSRIFCEFCFLVFLRQVLENGGFSGTVIGH